MNMKQNNQLLTEATFKQELKKRDVKLADIKRDTKALWQGQLKLEERIENVEKGIKELRQENRKRFDESDNRALQYRDDIMTKMDDLIGKYETAEQERTIGNYHMSELQKQVDKNEQLLSKLTHH